MISNQVLANPSNIVTQGASEIRIAQRRIHFFFLMDRTKHSNKTKVRAVATGIAQIFSCVKEIKQSETFVITTASAKPNIVKFPSVMSSMPKTN